MGSPAPAHPAPPVRQVAHSLAVPGNGPTLDPPALQMPVQHAASALQDWASPVHVGWTVAPLQTPLWQVPPAQGVPSGFFPLHLPFLGFLQGGHFFFLALVSRGEVAPMASASPPLRAARARRREPLAVRARARVSNRSASMMETSRIACERRWRPGTRTAHSRQRRWGCCGVGADVAAPDPQYLGPDRMRHP